MGYIWSSRQWNRASGGATLGPKGALAPPKYLKKLVYI